MESGDAVESIASATTSNPSGAVAGESITGLHRRHSANSTEGFADAALARISSQAGRCLDVTRNYLSSNPYASIDICSDLNCSSRRTTASQYEYDIRVASSTTNVPAAESRSAVESCACNLAAAQDFVGFSTVQSDLLAQHIPYVGNLIPLHCGHNGWPAATALASLNDFFVANSID
jgi:hypothetical protein